MTQPIIKDTIELYPVMGSLPTVNYTVTKFSVRVTPRELETTISLFLNEELVSSLVVEADARATKAITRRVSTNVELSPQDKIECMIAGSPPPVPRVSVTKYPTAPYPNWQTWQIGGPVQPWCFVGTDVKMMAAADPAVCVRGSISSWDEASKKFRIDLLELVGDVTPYNSWFMELDGEGKTALVSKVTINCEYTKVEEPEIVTENDPIVIQEPAPPRPKRRRIMM